jgi:sulfate adenylyltransferase subunit 2
MDYLSVLESESIYIIREAYHRYRRLVLLWSMGKDSTTLLWLCRKAFLGRVPFPAAQSRMRRPRAKGAQREEK